jgi:hypothetical protein
MNQLKEITKIDPQVPVYYPDDIQKMRQSGTGIDDPSKVAKLASQTVIFLKVEQDHDRESLATTATSQVEQIPVFIDDALKVYLTPIYGNVNVTMNIEYQSNSKTEIERWRQDLRMRISMLRDMNVHKIHYHYNLPGPFLQVLKLIHQYREQVDGYGQMLDEYIVSNASPKLTLVSDIGAKTSDLVIAEEKYPIVGTYGFEGIPDKATKNDNSTWSVNFSYTFMFDCPIGCNLRYPVMVHNQLLPEKYVRFENPATAEEGKAMSQSKSLYALNSFRADFQAWQELNKREKIIIPAFDDYVERNIPVSTVTIIRALCEMVPGTPNQFLNLNELGDVMIDPDIYDFIIKSEYPYITRPFRSILLLSLYEGDSLIDDKFTNLDTSGNFTSSSTSLSLRHSHRVRLSIVTDLSLIDPAFWKRLDNYEKAKEKLMDTVGSTQQTVYITSRPMKTVMTTWIIAGRK